MDLEKLLADAGKAAKGDARVEKIVARDAEFFRLTFLKGASEFQAARRENEIRAGEYAPDWGQYAGLCSGGDCVLRQGGKPC